MLFVQDVRKFGDMSDETDRTVGDQSFSRRENKPRYNVFCLGVWMVFVKATTNSIVCKMIVEQT